MIVDIAEAFDNKKAGVGEVNFSTSSLSDPFIIKVIKLISGGDIAKEQQMVTEIQQEQHKMSELATKAPLLLSTMVKNIVESELFTFFCMHDIDVPGAPKFSNVIFNKLMVTIEGNHDRFLPLASYIDGRTLPSNIPKIKYVYNTPDFKNEKKKLTTASASPKGEFTFNVPFMQKLMDWQFLKGVPPKRALYKSNGGKFPDEYAPLEFLVIHEFLHYSEDDFYYQHTIPNAKNKIINYVGDFRSNYSLVKSGYQQLPIGLYADAINFDRQGEYIDMYNTVKEELEKLPPGEKGAADDYLEGQTDDHTEGQADGNTEEAREKAEGKNAKDQSEHGKKELDKVEQSKDSTDTKPKNKEGEDRDSDHNGRSTGVTDTKEKEYKSIQPTFTWRKLIDKFIVTPDPETIEVYDKIDRRAAPGLSMLQQNGAGYIPPAEIEVEADELKIAFVMDTSGSMQSAVPRIMAEAVNLLKGHEFSRSIVSVYKFSGESSLEKVNIALKKSTTCNSIKDKPKTWTHPADHAFTFTFGGGTNFDGAFLADIVLALKTGYNIIISTDTDLLSGINLTNLENLLRAHKPQIFIIFNDADTYSEAGSLGILNANMSYFK